MPIIDPRVESKLRLQFDGTPVATAVFPVKIRVWNAGGSVIKGEDCLEPTSVRIEGHVLAVRPITQLSRSEIAVTTGAPTFDAASGYSIVPLQWRILEPSDAFVVDLLTASDDSPSVQVIGSVVGQRRIETLPASAQRHTISDLWSLTQSGLMTTFSFAFCMLVLLSIGVSAPKAKYRVVRWLCWPAFILAALLVIGFGVQSVEGIRSFRIALAGITDPLPD